MGGILRTIGEDHIMAMNMAGSSAVADAAAGASR